MFGVQQHRDAGDFEYERRLLPPISLAGVAATPKIDQGKPLEDVIAAYLKDREKYKKWKPGSQGDFIYILDVFRQIVGNVPIKSIRAEQVQRYKDVLEQLPTGMSKAKKYQGKTIAEVVKMKPDKTLAPATIQKHLNTVSALFKWAERWGYVDRSYMGGMSVPVTGTAQDERKPWTTEDLNRIFSPDTYPMDGLPYRFWLPTIALYSGMRLEEISQLHLEDIRQEDGVWVFDVNKEGIKTLKTISSKRLVPMHPFLIEVLGLPRYADGLKAKGAKRLFPELKKTDRYKFGKNATAWFSNYKKRIAKIEDSDKSFHSFRHTFVNNLKQQFVDPFLLDELLGHKIQKLSMGTYGDRFNTKNRLEQAICKLDYGVDLSHLSQSPYASGK